MQQQQQQQPKPHRPIKQPTDSVSSACSLPNLSARPGTSNTQYAVLSQRGPACTTPRLSGNAPIPVIAQAGQPLWNGNQALNNQVAPGNRANNYWDNFRR